MRPAVTLSVRPTVRRDVGGGNDSPGDGFAVKQALVAGFGLERVADGVAEIEHAAQAAFVLVGGNDFGFQLHGLRDKAFQFHRIALQNLRALLFKAQEKIEIADDAALERLVEARRETRGRKACAKLRGRSEPRGDGDTFPADSSLPQD